MLLNIALPCFLCSAKMMRLRTVSRSILEIKWELCKCVVSLKLFHLMSTFWFWVRKMQRAGNWSVQAVIVTSKNRWYGSLCIGWGIQPNVFYRVIFQQCVHELDFIWLRAACEWVSKRGSAFLMWVFFPVFWLSKTRKPSKQLKQIIL